MRDRKGWEEKAEAVTDERGSGGVGREGEGVKGEVSGGVGWGRLLQPLLHRVDQPHALPLACSQCEKVGPLRFGEEALPLPSFLPLFQLVEAARVLRVEGGLAGQLLGWRRGAREGVWG